MNSKILKYLRLILAILIGGTILLFFLDFTRLLPEQLHILLVIQIVPAIMASHWGIVLIMLLITLIFGRIYCSVICPLGILQDVIIRVKQWWQKATKQKKHSRTKYTKPLNILRYSILSIVGICFVAGFSYPLLLLDPYSNFGRIATGLFRPIAIWINNMFASALATVNNYSLYNVSLDTATVVVVFAIIVLTALIVAVWRRGRIACNSICPVGALLSIFSRFSRYRITLGDNCNGCKKCATACKAYCIDTENKKVDMSRCVGCFNCLGKCNQNALSFSPSGWKLSAKSTAKEEFALTIQSEARRRFIKGSLITVATLSTTKLLGQNCGSCDAETEGCSTESCRKGSVSIDDVQKPMPPGAGSLKLFKEKCTACQLCISKCPTQLLQPAFMEYGLTGMMMPYMKFRTESFCNYECTVCIDVCPNNALQPLTIEQKKLTRVGNVIFVKNSCIVSIEHQDCGACAEHCPTQAVHMVPFGDSGLTIPEITPDLCIGCGGCQSICPMTPPAIYISGVITQDMAAIPSIDTLEKVEITDFGF